MEDILARISAFTGPDAGKCVTKASRERPQKETITVSKRTRKFGLLCFSKDRPFQLDQMLVSFKSAISTSPHVSVVLCCAGIWADEYCSVFRKHSDIHVIYESDFSSNLATCVELIRAEIGEDGLLLLTVDDLIFVSRIDISNIMKAFEPHPIITAEEPDQRSIFGYFLKLHPGIYYSHPASRVCWAPQFSGPNHREGQPLSHLTFRFHDGELDWCYPVDLCAGIYRVADIIHLIALCGDLYGPGAISNPNKMEVYMNKAFSASQLSQQYIFGACSASPRTCVITVNKVQETYEVPIYHTDGGDLGSLNCLICKESSIDPELEMLGKFSQLDTEAYFNADISLSAHVGALLFVDAAARVRVDRPLTQFEITVVIPVYNGAAYLKSCMYSLLLQPQGCNFKVIVADDGSSDDSYGIARAAADEAPSHVVVTVLRLGRVGLACALDTAVAAADTELIARLDCDDISEPWRLNRQASFLRANPHIHILGTQAILFHTDDPASVGSDNVVATGIPTHPVLVEWALLFRCPILHPTVMFRKSTIAECGGYTTHMTTSGYSCEMRPGMCTDSTTDYPVPTARAEMEKYSDTIEDYNLWARVLKRFPFSCTNLPDVLVHIRRHPGSKSRRESSQATASAVELRRHLIDELLRSRRQSARIDSSGGDGSADCSNSDSGGGGASSCIVDYSSSGAITKQTSLSATRNMSMGSPDASVLRVLLSPDAVGGAAGQSAFSEAHEILLQLFEVYLHRIRETFGDVDGRVMAVLVTTKERTERKLVRAYLRRFESIPSWGNVDSTTSLTVNLLHDSIVGLLLRTQDK